MSKVMRSVKNVTKGYSSNQVKVREATSNDNWGPTGSQMAEIAQLTFASSDAFYEVVDMLDKRLNDKGKNWRHVLKALQVLDYCLHEGSENVVKWAKSNVYIIKTLREFQHIEEDDKDVGQNIRVSAKELTSLILDDARLAAERKDRKSWKSRVSGLESVGFSSTGDSAPPRRKPDRRDRRADEEEAEVRLAIEASKHEAEEEERRRKRNAASAPDDDDLQKALKLSKEEEDLRRRELEESNASALFDDAPVQNQQPAPTGNNGYTQMQAVDWQGLPIDQQATGYMQNGFNPAMTGQITGVPQHQTGFVSQPTGYQNGFSNGFQQPQQPNATGFDPHQAFGNPAYAGYPQQPQQSQQTGFDAFSGQPQQQFQPQQQQDIFGAQPQAGSNNPWGSNQPADALKPTPTGSNNPFASSFSRPTPSQPTLSTLTEQKTQTQFNNTSFNPSTSFQPQSNPPPSSIPQIAPPPPSQPQDPHHARLNALLATGEGQDTFGNVGDLRIPAQHTAPGTFVNSAGQGLDKLHATQTGSNPFFNHQQFTGGPGQQQQSYGLASAAGLGAGAQQQGRMMPAQTGPAGVVGFGGQPSPFGPQGGAQQQGQNPYARQQGGQSGSLIDL